MVGNREVSAGALVPLEEARGAISIVVRREAVSGEWRVAVEEIGGRGAAKMTFPLCVPPWPLPRRVLARQDDAERLGSG